LDDLDSPPASGDNVQMERINLLEGDIKDHVALAAKGIRDGYVICAPLEHGYVFLADAFSEFAVRAMHVLRGDALGVSAQVLIHSHETITGLSRDVTDDTRALMKEFWPGLISFNLRPSMGIRWNLGDNGSLDRFSVRVPDSEFIRALLKETGPLAVASAARVGQKPALNTDRIFVLESDLAVMCEAGELPAGPATTIIEADSAAMTIIREGAITREQLAAIVPALSDEQPIG
jgi:tRNA threonylcarbamoyl adenosine modification protein (Sua5/YciO/YrdC/YwlC family)